MPIRWLSAVPKESDRGPDVGQVQIRLNEMGAEPRLAEDEVFGPKTTAAILAEQQKAGLTQSGILTKETLEHLSMAVMAKVEPKPATEPTTTGKIDRNYLVDRFLANIKRLIDKPIRETNGKNRSPDIDSWNKRTFVPMGSPYCASSIWCEWEDACKELGLKFPMKATASSQAFATQPPAKYVRKAGEAGKRGDAGVLQNIADPGYGHMTVLREDQITGSEYFQTYEFNTDGEGSRDGDGGYPKTRSIKGDSQKRFRCFVDIPQWILDTNAGNLEKPTEPSTTDVVTLPWDGKHADSAKWTETLVACIEKSQLPEIVPADADQFCKGYDSLPRAKRIEFWANLFAIIAKYECGYNPESASVDVGTKNNLDTYSVGLFQLSVVDQQSYKFDLGFDFDDLKDGSKNIQLAIPIAARLVAQDNRIAGKIDGKWKGLTRYWAVMRAESSVKDQSESAAAIKAYLTKP